jgi:hypothetical protein
MGSSFVEPAFQDVLYTMNLHRDIGRRKAGDFGNCAGGQFALLTGRHTLNLLDAGKRFPNPPLANYMPDGYIIGNAINPGSKRTALVEVREAAPQLKVNVLQQVANRFGVRLIRAGESL